MRDTACLACHSDIRDHADHARLRAARGPMSWGEGFQRAVATMFNKPAPGACTDCHTEHQGAGHMAPTRQKFCADCHGTLDQRLTRAMNVIGAVIERVQAQQPAGVETEETE